ncbi:alpha-1,4-glucan--maltose-1-phosphate maltosyltransferase [Zhihengliuella alba]|uniref:Alpha-1,4-glucan:maltose-1-phosphate maltosyltransferase n=1 Tax=Zhihengliuella alba TaxID=547018 RepID=A0ABP7DYG8_9MICC
MKRLPATRFGRIPVTDVQPVVDGGRFPAKAVTGQDVPVSATCFREGHDAVGATAVLYRPDGSAAQRVRMVPGAPGTDRWHATLRPDAAGAWTFEIEGWDDPYGTWHHAAGIKIGAGIEEELMLAEGARLFAAAARDRKTAAADAELFRGLARVLEDTDRSVADRFAAAESPELTALLAERPIRRHVTRGGAYPLLVERRLAGQGAWYEFFPRSEGAVLEEEYDDGTRRYTSGTFATARHRLDAVARMGFDVVYLPPIHPIGRTHRKGPNNTLTAGEHDPGSPWAIGAAEGGHDAIHPDLGTVEDFAAFVDRARELGLEVALDLALQASPDHPWVAEHPQWFTTRADGSIAYAENPPKKYQDIYPLNFDNDPKGLREEVLRIVLLWIERGVRIFRVDNPHTKPLWFWEWLIREVSQLHPDAVFLAEAFTRPAMMHALGKAGFQQSYTYFTWRNTREELEEYLTEVSHRTSPYFRPSFWVNTPDILPEFLQYGGPAAFKLRAAIAATGSPLWGVYTGYELCENAARPGSGEYADNEKYEYKPRDFAAAEAEGRSLAPYLTRLNEIRRAHPALGDLANVHLHTSTDEATLVFSKSRPAPRGLLDGAGSEPTDTVLVVVNLDPHAARESTVTLDLPALDLTPGDLDGDGRFEVRDLLTGQSWRWGEHNYVRLDPYQEPAHILHIVRSTA